MRTRKVTVKDENLGVVRVGFSGLKTVLEKNEKGYCFKWISRDTGKTTFAIDAQEGMEYVIGPKFAKVLPSPPNIMKKGDIYGLPAIRHIDENLTEICPATVKWLRIKPLSDVSYQKCLVNRIWLRFVSYEEFCEEMKKAREKHCDWGDWQE